MGIKFDTYSFRARVLPVYLSLVPGFLLVAVLVPEGLQLLLGGAVAIVFVPISFLCSQIGADFGKRLERELWEKWGGAPTTRFLRHGNTEFNVVTRARVHEKLRALGLHVPTSEEQAGNQHAADEHYESCTQELIRRTRDTKSFPLVLKGLTEYGFRRNMLGLRRFGVSIAAGALLVGGGWCLYSFGCTGTSESSAVAIVSGLMTIGLIAAWFVWVTERTAFISANRYARFLLEAALDLEV